MAGGPAARRAPVPAGHPPGCVLRRPDIRALVPFVIRHTAVGTSLRLPVFRQFRRDQHPPLLDRRRRPSRRASSGRWRPRGWPLCGFTRTALGVPYTWAKMQVNRSRRRDLVRECAALAPPRPAQHVEGPDRRRGGVDTARGVAHLPVGSAHPQGRADMVGAQRARSVAVACGRDPRAGRRPARRRRCGTAGDRLRALYSPGVHARFGRPIP